MPAFLRGRIALVISAAIIALAWVIDRGERDRLAVYALTLAILTYAPLHQVALQQNFRWHRENRERIVARVEAGELKPNVSGNQNLIALGDREPNVSAAGNAIAITISWRPPGSTTPNRYSTQVILQ